MKSITTNALAVCLSLLVASASHATVYRVAFSPPAAYAVNLAGAGFIYPGDYGLGLSPANEPGGVASTASGGELSPMTFDDATNTFTFDFGYGAALGFDDLVSNWNGGVHIHGNGTSTANFPAANTNAPVIYDLASSHTASGTRAGRVTGSRVLTDTHETWLLQNRLYINIHSNMFTGGEIRGQLVIVPEPASALLALCGAAFVCIRRRSR